jgi:repressor LexA
MITRAQQKTLDFIKQFISDEGHAPTAGEIAQGIGITSRGVVHRNLRALEAAGLLTLTPHRHRNIQLEVTASNEPLAARTLPLIGAIAAGQPIEAIIDHDPINLADIFLGENRYALRVKGDSMIDEGIFNGDIVVCEHARMAANGQIVVALIDQQHATLKHIHYEKNEIVLLPANQTLKPMRYAAERVEVQGIYIGLFRMH